MSEKKETPYEGWREYPKWIGTGEGRKLVNSAEEEAALKPAALPLKK